MPPISFDQYIKFAGRLVIVASIFLIGFSGNLYFRGHNVKVEITAMANRSVNESDAYVPTFKVIEGEFDGKRYKVTYGSSFVGGERGDILDGKYDPFTNRILSNSLALMEFVLGFLIFGVGLVMTFGRWEVWR